MFGSIGSLEILLIVVVALLVVGPKRLPKVARTLGKMFGEFKRVTGDVQRTINAEVEKVEKAERAVKAKAELMPEDVVPKPASEKVVSASEDTASETAQPAKGA